MAARLVANTYAYIAKLQALSCLTSQPGKNNISLPETTEFVPLAAVLVEADAGSLDNIAQRHGINAEELRLNNPAYTRGKISAQSPRRILMPAYLANASFAGHSRDKVAENAISPTLHWKPAVRRSRRFFPIPMK